MRVAIATVQVPFVRGGAELLAESLLRQLRLAGHEAEIVSLPFKWYPPERILEAMLACRMTDLTESSGQRIDRVIGLKFPAYMIPHPEKVLWLLHQHRAAYDLWDTPLGDLMRAPEGAHVRAAIRNADMATIPEARGIYTISSVVSRRLEEHCGIASRPLLHPPPNAELIRPGPSGDYVLFPSRINEMKRQELVVEALALTRHPVRLVLLGAPDSAAYAARVRARAESLPPHVHVEWAGAVSEEEKRDLYAQCRAVVFPPVDEDYGYVTLEAMLAEKPVLTCTDSGGPLAFVRDGETGFVRPPEPAALAEALDRLAGDAALARRLGQAGRAFYAELGIGWDEVLHHLLAPLPR